MKIVEVLRVKNFRNPSSILLAHIRDIICTQLSHFKNNLKSFNFPRNKSKTKSVSGLNTEHFYETMMQLPKNMFLPLLS